jgi:hypothetical protein
VVKAFSDVMDQLKSDRKTIERLGSLALLGVFDLAGKTMDVSLLQNLTNFPSILLVVSAASDRTVSELASSIEGRACSKISRRESHRL